MPPKAIAKPKARGPYRRPKAIAKPKARGPYRRRQRGSRVVPPALEARNRQRQAAVLGRPGSLHRCPYCGFPRHVPHGFAQSLRCALPFARLPPNNRRFGCGFRTTASAWWREPLVSTAYGAACETVAVGLIETLDAKCNAGEMDDGDFWSEFARELASRAEAHLQHQEPPNQPAGPPAAA